MSGVRGKLGAVDLGAAFEKLKDTLEPYERWQQERKGNVLPVTPDHSPEEDPEKWVNDQHEQQLHEHENRSSW